MSLRFRGAIFSGISLCGNYVTLLTSCYGQEMYSTMAAIVCHVEVAGERRFIQALVFRG